MQELLRENKEFRDYFNSLPKFVQESLTQSTLNGQSEEDIRNIAENLMKNNKIKK